MSDPVRPPPPVTPTGGVSFFDDPKTRAVLQTWVIPIVIGYIARKWKLKEDPQMVADFSTWLVSTILPALGGGIWAVWAIYKRWKAGKDPNNPAKPLEAPMPIQNLLSTVSRLTK